MTSLFNRITPSAKFARASALCLLAIAAALCAAGEARAQWTAPDASGNINSTNTGNVGVGTSVAASKLDISGASGVTVRTGGASAGVTIFDRPSVPGDQIVFQGNTGNYSLINTATRNANFGSERLSGFAMWTVDNANTGNATQFQLQNSPAFGGVIFTQKFGTGAQGDKKVSFQTAWNQQTLPTQFVLDTTGNVGIGTAAPLKGLQVNQATGGAKGILISGDEYYMSGNGTAADGMLLLLGVNRPGNRQLWMGDAGNVGSATASFFRVLSSGSYVTADAVSGNGLTRMPLNLGSDTSNVGVGFNDFTTAPASRLSVSGNLAVGAGYRGTAAPGGGAIIEGSVGIGTNSPASKLHVVGNITVEGNINAKYQDVAEWVPSTQKLSAGTVVVLDTGRDNHVLASHGAYDTRVAGVISAQPGLSLGEAGEGKALVATTGRVKVRVDATQGPISVGDLLVTSDREGYAMKSEAVLIGKRQFHSPGTIIGKALQSLAGGTGEILVLLSLQ